MADRRAGLTSAAPAAPSTLRWRARRCLSWLAVALLLLVVGSVAGVLPVRVMRVGSESMTPTIAVGDLLVVDRWHSALDRQDVVVVRHPDTRELLVKRAVGLGGDQVAIEDGVLVVNGQAVCEPTIDPSRLDGVWFGPVTVPDGDVFLMGDDRGNSIDSRDFGPVPAGDVEGQIGGRLWPSPGRLPADSC